MTITLINTRLTQIKAAQKDDEEIWAVIQNIDQQTEFRVDDDGILWQGLHFRFLQFDEMYHDESNILVGSGMKRDVATEMSVLLLVGSGCCERILEGPEMIEGLMKVAVARNSLRKLRLVRELRRQTSAEIREDLSYTEEPESILDRQDRVMRNKTIPFVKILWRNHPEREATWETEESIRTSYPHFLPWIWLFFSAYHVFKFEDDFFF
ncbi:putative reverse transcriptase domain-containing protein [Tanacetum coccineum]|uniref:Reverse transcriptase domain-containing protein n=1 Tax=Tanacetum coccineum TaxID=301880 RepID=A0ABQ5B3E2_9ASTR